MNQLSDITIFLKKFHIDFNRFESTHIQWPELQKIFTDYSKSIQKMQLATAPIYKKLMGVEKINSIKYRIKDPEHLIEKIIRKKIQNPGLTINANNYSSIITDLIGLRALHLFKEDWPDIHTSLVKTFRIKDTPVANYREGDNREMIEKFQQMGCSTHPHPFGYRSIHYLVETESSRTKYLAEIQVCTLFEEAWSEIDHNIRYPNNSQNPTLGKPLLILNTLANSADEMGSFIRFLKNEQR
jgi:ppGpp synthetase/RelA/SpoT-type nucleotidyltranferase